MNDAAALKALQAVLDYTFINQGVALEALTHASYRGEHPQVRDNQRLEFLGDAVLQLACAEFLYNLIPWEEEGVLTRLRAALVCQSALTHYGEQWRLRDLLRIASPADIGPKQISDAFEAVLGAVFLDGGYAPAQAIAHKVLSAHFDQASASAIDAKSALQEALAGRRLPAPVYTVTQLEGPSHLPVYHATVQFNHHTADGKGSSKKRAEMAAAQAAMNMLAENPQ